MFLCPVVSKISEYLGNGDKNAADKFWLCILGEMQENKTVFADE